MCAPQNAQIFPESMNKNQMTFETALAWLGSGKKM